MTFPRKPARVAAGALTLVTALWTTPAVQAEPKRHDPPQQCFFTRNIENYAVVNDRLLYLRVGVADVYRLDLLMDCPELPFRFRDIEITHTGTSDQVCAPVDLTIRFRQIAARRICPVGDMRKLTPAEVAALPKNARP